MANLYRLIGFLLAGFFIVFWTASPVRAETIAATGVLTPSRLMVVWPYPTAKYYSSAGAGCAAGAAYYGSGSYVVSSGPMSTSGGITPCSIAYHGGAAENNGLFTTSACYADGGAAGSSCTVYSCPASAGWSLSGSSCVRTDCVVGYMRDASGVCVAPPGPCDVGTTPKPTTAPLGWFAPDDLPGVYAAQSALIKDPSCQSGYGSGGTVACSVNFSANTAAPLGSPGSNGYSFYTAFLTGRPTGATCTPSPVLPQSPEPACQGSSGTVNGTVVCAPKLTQAEQDRLASSAASNAAQQAHMEALNAVGATAASASAASQAAAAAAALATRNGATPAQAAQAGAAAGKAASDNAIAGGGVLAGVNGAIGAGAGQLAYDRAIAIATSAGLSAPAAVAVANEAKAAAVAAANNAIAQGGSKTAQAAAASAAGINATTSGIMQSGSVGSRADAAAAAGAGALGGAANGTGSLANGTPGADPMGDFCAKNPLVKMCKVEGDSSWIGGDCSAVPSCTGDAILCAVAAQTFKTQCALSDPGTATPLYDAAKVKTGDQTTDNPKNSTVTVGAGNFDQTNLLGAASGMTDRTITVMGSSIILPFSDVNIWLARFGIVLQAVTFLLCARIVVRG